MRRATLGEGSAEFARSLSELALLHNVRGDHARARPLYEQALRVLRQALGERHPDYATTLSNLASLYHDVGEAGRRLRRLVWEPLARHLGGARAVLVAPDGALTGLPLASLPGRRTGSYLIEEVAVGYLTSSRQLLQAGEPPARARLVVSPAAGPTGPG